MKPSRSKAAVDKENIVKRLLLVIGTAVLFISTLVTPITVKADGGAGNGTGCGGRMCKP